MEAEHFEQHLEKIESSFVRMWGKLDELSQGQARLETRMDYIQGYMTALSTDYVRQEVCGAEMQAIRKTAESAILQAKEHEAKIALLSSAMQRIDFLEKSAERKRGMSDRLIAQLTGGTVLIAVGIAAGILSRSC